MSKAFLDTNVLLYAAGIHPEEQPKRAIADDLIATVDWATSTQVLQEFLVNSTRPSKPAPLPIDLALDFMAIWRDRPVQPITLDLVDRAVSIHRRHRFNYWDCAVIAAAIAQGCETLYSEDLSHGQTIEGVRLVNPFLNLA